MDSLLIIGISSLPPRRGFLNDDGEKGSVPVC